MHPPGPLAIVCIVPITEPQLRTATEADIEFLARVSLRANEDRYCRHPGWDADKFYRGVLDFAADQVAGNVPNSTTFVITEDGVDVGRLRLVTTTTKIEIAGLQVMPEHQNRGIGTAVITSVLNRARQTGIPVELEVETDNPDARRLYERLKFHATGATKSDSVTMIRTAEKP